MGHRLVPGPALARNTVLCMLSVVAATSGIATVLVGDPGHDAYAQQGGSLNVTEVGSLADDTELLLGNIRQVDTFVIGNSTYAAAASLQEHGLQLVNVTDPASPTAAGKLEDDTSLLLKGSWYVTTFVIGTDTYAAVTSYQDDGLQLVNVTDPASPTAAGRLADDSTLLLKGTRGMDTFVTGNSTYVAAASPEEGGLQIVDVTDPASPTAAGKLEDTDNYNELLLDAANSVDTFVIGNSTYAAVASSFGLQIVDVTDPASPTAAGRLADDSTLLLGEASSVTTFVIGTDTYAAVTSHGVGGLQLVNVTDPASPTAAGRLADDSTLLLGDTRDVTTFVIGTDTYAVVTSWTDGGLQIVDVTDPASPTAAGMLEVDTFTPIARSYSVDTFVIGNSTYVAAAFHQEGLLIMGLEPLPDTTGPLAPDTHVTTPEDTPVTVTPEIPDPHGDLPGITWVDTPANGTTTHDATSVTYTPAQDYVGDDSFGYTVSYGKVSERGTITVTVTRDNNAPVLDAIGDRAATVGTLLDIVPTVTDADPTDTHTFSITRGTLPAAAVFTKSDGSLAWTPAQADAGSTHTVTMTVDDGRGGTDSETFDIVTMQQNDPPQLSPLVFTVAEGDTMSESIAITDDTPGDGLTFALDGSQPTGLTVTSKAGSDTDAVIAWTAPAEVDVESYAFNMTVSDGVSYVTETVTINIEEVNQDPEFDIMLTQKIALEDTLEMQLAASDGDRPEQALSYNITGQPAPPASLSSGSTLAWTPAALGNHTMTVTVTDDFDPPGSDSAEISVEVIDVLPPVINLNGDQNVTLELGGTYDELGASVSDNDPAYSTTEATVGGDTVDASTAGVYTVTYTAPADEAGNEPDDVSRTVSVQDTNAPVITLVGDDPLAHELGDTYTDPGATADDGSAVIIDGSAVDVNVDGDYVVTYTATDGDGNKGMASRTVEVRDTTKPVITLNGGQSVTVELGDAYSELGATVSDNDPAYDGTASASETVDADTVGVYTVTYTAPADEAGNEPDPVSRTVTVQDTAAPDPPRSPPKPEGPSGGGGGAGSVTSEHNRGVNRNPLVYVHSVAWDCTAGTAIVAAGPAPDGTTVDFTERKITEVDHAVTDPAPNGMTATVFTLKSAQYQTGSSIRIGDTVVFTIPMHPEETYMAVQVAAEINGYMGQAAEIVNVDSCVGGKAFAGSDIIRLPQKTPQLEVGGRQTSDTEPSLFRVSMEPDEAPEPAAKEHSDTEHRVSSDAKTMPEAASGQMAEQTHTEWTLAPCGEDGTLLADYMCTTGQQGNNEDDIGAQNEPVEPAPTERCDLWCVLSSVFA